MDRETIEQFARVGARYWADHLRAGATPSLVRDAGYTGRGEFVTGAGGDFLIREIKKTMPGFTSEEVDRYEEALMRLIVNDFASGRTCVQLCVDYDPCPMLFYAFAGAKISTEKVEFRFPYKTHMWIEENGVQIKGGYGIPMEWLLTTKRAIAEDEILKKMRELPFSPYREGREDKPFSGEEYDKYEACRRRLISWRQTISPMPSTPFDQLVEEGFAYAVGPP